MLAGQAVPNAVSAFGSSIGRRELRDMNALSSSHNAMPESARELMMQQGEKANGLAAIKPTLQHNAASEDNPNRALSGATSEIPQSVLQFRSQ
jgi:hypothetical protein